MYEPPSIDLSELTLTQLREICNKYYIKKLSLFGSSIQGTQTPQSDVDILVEFYPDHTPGFSFVQLQDELSSLLHCEVDLQTPDSLSRYFKKAVLKEAHVLYAQD